jgi:hypothetical protein
MGFVENVFKEVERTDELTSEKIIAELLTGKNKEFKTEIRNPLAFSTLDLLGDYIKKVWNIQKDNENPLKIWCSWYRTNMISHNRESRKEVVSALQAVRITEQEEREKKGIFGRILNK